MTHPLSNRGTLVIAAGLLTLALATVATPAGRNLAVGALDDFIEIAEEVAHFPCWLADHSKCFSPDWLDPTCPQCI